MRVVGALVVVILVLAVAGIAVFVVGAAAERRAIREQFRSVPGIATLEVVGDSDAGIRARVSTGGEGYLEVEALTAESFSPDGSVYIQQVGKLRALTTGCYRADARAGPYWTHSFSLGQGGKLSHILSAPLAGVPDAVARYAELETLFASLPPCPRFSSIEQPDWPGQLRYCVYEAGVRYPDVSPTQTCQSGQ